MGILISGQVLPLGQAAAVARAETAVWSGG